MKLEKEKTEVKKALSDILSSVKWTYVSTNYFGKSRSWFSQRLNGCDGNRNKGGFSLEEKRRLKSALYDLADNIKLSADKI